MARASKRAKRLKPTGHSALIESMIQPAIVIGSTLMSAIAAYVLAVDEITRILNRQGTHADYFIVALCGGMGFLIDMAIIVSATRYKMHAVRGDPGERRWLTLAKWVLGVGLASETMTLFYFFVHLSAQQFPDWIMFLAALIHSILAVSRSFLPPVIIAYFAAGVLPVMFDRADRNREIKSRTSANIMVLIDRLSEVHDTDDKTEMLQSLGGMLVLDTYAHYDETGTTTEDAQLHRDAKLLTHLARIHKLDWSEIGTDVAPELTKNLRYESASSTRPFERSDAHSDVTRSNAPALLEPDQDDEGSEDEEPPENDPNPPRGKRAVRPDTAGRDAYRSNVRKVSPNSSQAAATTTRSNAPAAQPKVAPKPAPKPKTPRSDSGESQLDRDELRDRRIAAAKAILKTDPSISIEVLARRIAMATQHAISKNTAYNIVVELKGRRPRSKTATVAQAAAEANS